MLRFLASYSSINPIVRVLVLSDFFMLAGLGFLAPMLPVFVANHITGGSIKVAGFASAIYMLMWVFQLPIGWFLDKVKGERDDFIFLVIGAFITAVSLYLFIFATLPWHVYAIQALAGLSRAIDLPAWFKLFTKKLDKNREGLEWSIENVVVALAIAFVGAISGLIVETYGFKTLFILSGTTELIGASILLGLYISNSRNIKKLS